MFSEPHVPVEALSPRENLLIEHPSMFVRPQVLEEKKDVTDVADGEKKNAAVSPQTHKKYVLPNKVVLKHDFCAGAR